MTTYILSIDQGTTSTRACLVDTQTLSIVGQVNKDFPQIYPKPSWVEHNLNDIWQTVEFCIREVLKVCNVQGKEIHTIGITNQRETTCAFNRAGSPLSNALVWQDRRTTEFCDDLAKKGHADKIKTLTGLTIDPYFSASKMNWLISHNPQVSRAAKDDNLLFGTIDTFLLYKLTGNQVHGTDASNASRTMLLDLSSSCWSTELLELFSIKEKFLPKVFDSFGSFGVTKGLDFLPDGIPITGILGDQQSALVGQASFEKGDMKCTYGTGAFALFNTGNSIIYSSSGLLTTVAYRHKGLSTFALEGSAYIAGAAVGWLRDNLGLVNKSSEIESLAREVKNYDEMKFVQFFPFFTGIGSPYWKSDAKAAIVGLTRDTHKSHIAHACLEGIALSINDLLRAIKQDTSLPISTLKVDGGASMNDLLLELQASISELTIIRPKFIETTALGAAMAAAIGTEELSFLQIKESWKKDRTFLPSENLFPYVSHKRNLWDTSIRKLYL